MMQASAGTRQLLSEISAGQLQSAERLASDLEARGHPREALLGRLLLATRRHDADAVRALAASPEIALLRSELRLRAELASSLYWTVGIEAAAHDLEAVCTNPAFPDHGLQQRACSLAALAQLAEQGPLRTLEGSAATVAFLESQTLPVLLASVNGLSPEYFILDTGAPTSLLSRSYCDQAGIPYLASHPRSARDGAGHEVKLYPALIDRLKLGALTIRRWPANVVELPANFRVAGLLSPLDTFSRLSTELDFRQRQIRLDACSGAEEWNVRAGEPVYSAPLLWDEGNVFVEAEIDGIATGWFLFDSGAGADCITPSLARRLGSPGTDNQPISSATLGGEGLVFEGFEAMISVSGSPPVRSRLMVKERKLDPYSLAPLQASGYLGVSWMSHRRILIPPEAREVLFTGTRLRLKGASRE